MAASRAPTIFAFAGVASTVLGAAAALAVLAIVHYLQVLGANFEMPFWEALARLRPSVGAQGQRKAR